MQLSPDAMQSIQTELKTFTTDLNLSDEQKAKVKQALEGAREKVEEYRKTHPDTTKEDIVAKAREHRSNIRQRLSSFLTPEQLTKWDAEVAKAKSFLGISS